MKRIVIIMAFSFLEVFLINGETLTSGEFSSIKSSTIFPSDIKLKTPNQEIPGNVNPPCLCYDPATNETGSSFLSVTDLASCKVGCKSNNWNGFIYYNSETEKYEYSIAPVFPSDIKLKTPNQEIPGNVNPPCLCYSLANNETADEFSSATDLISCKVGCINNNLGGFIYYNSEANKYEYGIVEASSTLFPSDITLKTSDQNKPDEQNPCLCYSLANNETGSGFLSATDLASCKVGCTSNNWDGFIYYNSEANKYEYGPSYHSYYDGCVSSGQPCTCENSGWKGTCGTGSDKTGLYCQCSSSYHGSF